MRKTTAIPTAALLVGLLIVVAAVAIVRHRAESECRRKCLVHLKNALLFETLSYAEEHDHQLPESLLTLVDDQRLSPSAPYWVCPRNRNDGPRSRADIETGKCDYVYLGKGLRDDTPDPSRTVVIYELEQNHGGRWISVGFADWHVEGVEAKTIVEAARLKGWSIPNPTRANSAKSTEPAPRANPH